MSDFCNMHSSRESCLADGFCGWCEQTSLCLGLHREHIEWICNNFTRQEKSVAAVLLDPKISKNGVLSLLIRDAGRLTIQHRRVGLIT